MVKLPLLILGFLAGAIFASLGPWPWPVSSSRLELGTLVDAGVTVAVGWWLQRVLTAETEARKVPLEAVGQMARRIETLVAACEALPPSTLVTDRDLLHIVLQLSEEVTRMNRFARQNGADAQLCRTLEDAFIAFKIALTNSDASLPTIGAATAPAATFKDAMVQVHWSATKQISAAV